VPFKSEKERKYNICMDEVNDQVQQDSPDTPDQAVAEQSETSTDVVEEAKPELYKDHLGRELTGEQLQAEYTKTASYITKLEQERAEWEKSAQKEAARAVSENTYLKDVDPNVREAIVQIVTPVIEDSLRRRDDAEQKRAQDEAFTKRLEELKTKYPGGDGLPKFDEIKVLAAMRDPSNSIYDPEWKFREMNWAKFVDYENKRALKGKSSDTNTEDTVSSQPRKPTSDKTPKTFEDAAKATLASLG
jgi:hypothetical protein